ncbi:uncharacterized protein BX663DRAFT_439128 [Cokeromyces recurvatus]|uniref:uncharacterized protein n=1 Tax=Cokeromyces recurvatus TaxID=90255 RepID=UPI00221ED172|nr:uncharacterized protein BX663DRAFT_439128 [Cokeromyces recurvatus]KAI7900661.1 hypothetical protein BX663DRAFT_439128 [Cokeromyces recurvatus]
MQLIEDANAMGKKPPFSLLLSLVNLILQPKEKLKTKKLLKEHWIYCKRAHAILMDALYLFGTEIYSPLWNQFRNFELIPTKRAQRALDDDYNVLDTNTLREYSDFWGLVNRVLNHGGKDLETKCRKLILDLFVNILQYDLKSVINDENGVKDSIFIQTLKKDALCTLSKFDNYLKILLSKFPNDDEELMHLSGDIFNMLITISCYEQIAHMDELVKQTYKLFQRMDAESCQQLMQVIKYPTFLILLCDKALADTNIIKVPKEHQHYRNAPHVPLHLEKTFFYVLKTLPNDNNTLEGIYRHVAIVFKYCACVFSTATISHKRDITETNSALPEDQLILLITFQHQIIKEWENMVEELINNVGFSDQEDVELVEKIRWTVKLTKLSIIEYF